MLAGAIVFATLVGAWMFRYEDRGSAIHRNRLTNAICFVHDECWFRSDELLVPETPEAQIKKAYERARGN